MRRIILQFTNARSKEVADNIAKNKLPVIEQAWIIYEWKYNVTRSVISGEITSGAIVYRLLCGKRDGTCSDRLACLTMSNVEMPYVAWA